MNSDKRLPLMDCNDVFVLSAKFAVDLFICLQKLGKFTLFLDQSNSRYCSCLCSLCAAMNFDHSFVGMMGMKITVSCKKGKF